MAGSKYKRLSETANETWLEDIIEELNDALCDFLHKGSEVGAHTPEAHLKLYYQTRKK